MAKKIVEVGLQGKVPGWRHDTTGGEACARPWVRDLATRKINSSFIVHLPRKWIYLALCQSPPCSVNKNKTTKGTDVTTPHQTCQLCWPQNIPIERLRMETLGNVCVGQKSQCYLKSCELEFSQRSESVIGHHFVLTTKGNIGLKQRPSPHLPFPASSPTASEHSCCALQRQRRKGSKTGTTWGAPSVAALWATRFLLSCFHWAIPFLCSFLPSLSPQLLLKFCFFFNF